MFRRRVLLVALGALAIRIAYITFVKRHDLLVGDEPYFHLTANWLAQGFGFTALPHSGVPSALHPPLYSLVLTPVSWVASGSAVLAQRLTGAVLGTLTVVVIGYLGREVKSERVGIIAAVLAACSPTLWVNDGVIMSESLAGLLIATALLLTYRYHRTPRLRTAVLLGLTCGLAALTRGELILLIGFLAVPLLLTGEDRRRRGIAAASALAVAVLVLAPWALYNVSRFEQPVYVSSNLGGTLCGANNARTYSGSEIGLWDRGACPPMHPPPVDQSELNDFWTNRSIDYARDHAGRLPLVAAVRLARITGLYAPGQMAAFEVDTGGRPRVVSWFAYGAAFLLAAFAVYGFVGLRRQHLFVAPLVAMIGFVAVLAVLLHGDVRYRLAADIALIVLAAAGVDQLVQREQQQDPAGDPELH